MTASRDLYDTDSAFTNIVSSSPEVPDFKRSSQQSMDPANIERVPRLQILKREHPNSTSVKNKRCKF